MVVLTLAAVAEKIGATVASGDSSKPIDGVANLLDATPRQLAPFTDLKYLSEAEKTQAGAILVHATTHLPRLPSGTALLRAADPEMAFIAALELLYSPSSEQPGVDLRAVVEPGVILEPEVYIGPYAVVRKGTRVGARGVIHSHTVIGRDCVLGPDCKLYPHVVLYDRVRLGRAVTVHSGVVLGADGFGYRFRAGRYVKIPQVGSVEIGDEVEIGANTCIDCAALGATSVGMGTKIDNLVQIAHGARVGQHCVLCGQAALAGSAGMGDYAVLGGNAGLADHVLMGKGARAAAKAGIAKDVPPGAEVFGLYADERKAAFRQLASIRRLPELVERVRALERELEKLRQK